VETAGSLIREAFKNGRNGRPYGRFGEVGQQTGATYCRFENRLCATILLDFKEIKEMLKDVRKSGKRVERGKDFVVNTKVEATNKKESFMVIKETKEKLQDLQKKH